MDIVTRDDLRDLLQAQPGLCVSLFMPTHRSGQRMRQDPIRYKNLLDQAEEQLIAHGMEATAARDMLASARELEGLHHDFWRRQSDGLAMFINQEGCRSYRVPLSMEESLFVDHRYHVRPLLSLGEGDGQFYILAVSQNAVRLYQGSRSSISIVTPDSLPKNLSDALNIDEYMQSVQFHAMREGTGTYETQAMFHGHGGSDIGRRKNDEIVEYFRVLDNGLQEFFGDTHRPLVFAGVEYLFPIFKETSHYSNIVETPVIGNPALLSMAELHEQAWQVVAPEFQQARRDALAKFGDRAARNEGTEDLQAIIAAAREGAVDVLFLREGASVEGTLDEESGEIREWATEGESRDLLECAAMHTLVNSGTVYVIPAEQMPSDHPAAALLRYPITWPAHAS
jgi:hypothetical protein